MTRKRKRKSQKDASHIPIPPSPCPSPPPAAVCIDASLGEGGGQIVRTALALSSVLNLSVHLRNIRHGRPNPGLQAQHLAGAHLISRISHAEIHNAMLRSCSLLLESAPTNVNREYSLPISAVVTTAGATSLVLQAALPAALCYLPNVYASQSQPCVSLVISGGTTALFAPTSCYLQRVLVPNLRHFGLHLRVDILQHGFYPRGGGMCHVSIDKSSCARREHSGRMVYSLMPCNLTTRGHVVKIEGNILICGAAYIAAEFGHEIRQKALHCITTFTRTHTEYPDVTHADISIENVSDREAVGECISCLFYATTESGTVLGRSSIWSSRDAVKIATKHAIHNPGKSATSEEKTLFYLRTACQSAIEAVSGLCDALRSGAVVDCHMADQLCMYMAMANGTSRLLVPKPTAHLTSVVQVLQSFRIDVKLEQTDSSDNCVVVCVGKNVPLRGSVEGDTEETENI